MFGEGGYVIFAHFLLWLTGVPNGIGGVDCANDVGINIVLTLWYFWAITSVFLWCM